MASVRSFFLFLLPPVTYIHLVIYLIIILIIYTRLLIYQVFLKTWIFYKKSQTGYYILKLYSQILSCNFININFQFKLIFNLFIIQYCFYIVDNFSIHLSTLQYESFLIIDFINGLDKNLSILYLIAFNSTKN